MNICSRWRPLPGIEARIPSVSGCPRVSHTLTVAHRSGEFPTGSGPTGAACAAPASAAASTKATVYVRRRNMDVTIARA